MSGIRATPGHILFNVVRDAFRKAGIPLNQDEKAIIVWFDTIKDHDYWFELKPYQISNRLPNVNLMCRKAPFVRLIQRISPFFPNLYSFLPKSWILPNQTGEFLQAVNKHDKTYIVKPDNGSLGAGITVIKKEDNYEPNSYMGIAQEYIESYLIDDTKFDCRIYVLIASVNPLSVYVYRGGIARFCSEKAGSNSIFSQLTNTAVNRKNSNVAISSITKMVNNVFADLKSQGINTDIIWKKIDAVIVLTVLSSYSYLLEGIKKRCPNICYPRCFQILGFDILLDVNLDPKILEVNYRPSLETDTNDEYNLKLSMLSDAMKIISPSFNIQEVVDNFSSNHIFNAFPNYNFNPMEISNTGQFVRVYPTNNPIQSVYNLVMSVARTLPASTFGNVTSLLPTQIDAPQRPKSTISLLEGLGLVPKYHVSTSISFKSKQMTSKLQMLQNNNSDSKRILPPLDPHKTSKTHENTETTLNGAAELNPIVKRTNLNSNLNRMIFKPSIKQKSNVNK